MAAHDITAGRLLLRVPEVAHTLGLGKTTVHDLIARGELRPVRVGRALRIPVADVQRWVEQQADRRTGG